MSETSKAVDPPKDNKKRYSRAQGAKRNSTNKDSQKSGTAATPKSTSNNQVSNNSKKLYVDANGNTNLPKWKETQETELGTKYGAMVASVFKAEYYKVPLPKRFMKVERMLAEAEGVQRKEQIANGVDPDNVTFEFDPFELDEVIEAFNENKMGIEFYTKVAGMTEDDMDSFQEHLNDLYQEKKKVYQKRLLSIEQNSETLFSDIIGTLSETSFNAIRDVSEDWDLFK